MTTDLPFYNNHPVSIAGRGWLIILAALALALAILLILPQDNFIARLTAAIAFAGIPLFALQTQAGRHWRALFLPVGVKQILLMLLFGMMTIFLSLCVGYLLSIVAPSAPNPIYAEMERLSYQGLFLRLLPTLPQLLGEELLTIIPLLATLWYCTNILNIGRSMGLFISIIASTAIFAVVHLPTYNWNWVQCFGIIGVARLVLTSAFLMTRNIWVSAGAHIFNDWTEFISGYAFHHMQS